MSLFTIQYGARMQSDLREGITLDAAIAIAQSHADATGLCAYVFNDDYDEVFVAHPYEEDYSS